MSQTKKIPLRMCIACREMHSKKEMIRIVSPSGVENPVALIDLKGKINGRGAYICQSVSCLDKARKSLAIKRALQCDVTDDLYQSIENLINLGGNHI